MLEIFVYQYFRSYQTHAIYSLYNSNTSKEILCENFCHFAQNKKFFNNEIFMNYGIYDPTQATAIQSSLVLAL